MKKRNSEKLASQPFIKKVISVLFCSMLIALSTFSIFGQENEQRVLNRIPKHLPLKVEIINGDMNSNIEDIKVKITNTGDKPIYFLHINLGTSGDATGDRKTKVSGGYGLTSFKFGNKKLMGIIDLKSEDDDPFEKDETVVFSVTDIEAKRFVRMLKESNINTDTTLALIFQHISFGDGTGFIRSDGMHYPVKKKL